MELAVQEELTARFLAHDRNATDLDVGPWFEPARNYTSSQMLAHERRILFRNYPVLVGFSSDLPTPHSYLATEIDGLPVVVTRAETHEVSAFVNVCRHRGAILFGGASGCLPGRTIACPYHSWTYDLDGRLIAQPQAAGGFDGLDRAGLGLTRIPVVEQAGLLFAEARVPKTTESSAMRAHIDGLAPLLDVLEHANLSNFVRVAHREFEGALNWKFVIDTFLESYHVFALHKGSVARLFHTNPSLFDAFGDGSRYVAFNRSVDAYLNQPNSDWDLTDHASIAYTLPPNSVLVTQGERVDLWQAFPLDPNRCIIRLSIYAKKGVTKSAEQWDFKAQFVNDVVRNEDFAVAERTQAALAAGALSELIFGANEPAVIHYHRSLQRILAADLLADR